MALTDKQKKIIHAIDTAEKSLVSYRSLILENDEKSEYKPAEYHHRWSDELLNGTKNEAKEGFRGCGKTQYVMRAYPLHRLQFPNPNCNYIILLKKNTLQARKSLKAISREYQTNPIASANLLRVIEDSGEVLHVRVLDRAGQEMEVRLEAYGKGQALRGANWVDKRPDIVIIDDPQDREDARSETILENDWDWFLSDVKFIGAEAGSRIFFIGNNLGEKSLAERILNNPSELGFNIERVPRLLEDGSCAWPERDNPEDIETLKSSYAKMGKLDIYYEEVMCCAVAQETQVFHEEDYRFFNCHHTEMIARDCIVSARLDPAASKSPESCFRAIVVNAVDNDGNWFVVDVPYGRWDPTELIDKVFDTVTKWRLKTFGIEKGMLKDIFEHFIYKEMAKRKIFFDIIPIEHAKEGTKLERIKMLAPRFKAHSIWFPDESPWLAEMKAELAGVTKDAIKSLFIDLVDALAMHQQQEERPFGREQQTNLPRRAVTGGRVI